MVSMVLLIHVVSFL